MLNEPRAGLRLINGTHSTAKIELRIEPGEEIEVPDGSVIELDRGPLRPVAEPVKAPAKKAPARKKTPAGEAD